VGSSPARSEQEVSAVARMLHWCEQHKDDFNLVFVGSSRVFHGLSPRLFDEIASTRGQQWHSFNLGMDRMGMAQSMKIIRELVATGPRNLQYVFFELESGTGMLPGGQNRTARPGGFSPAPDNHRLGGLGPNGDGFFPLARSMTAEMQPIYAKRLAAAKANPVKPQPNEVVRSQLTGFAQEMATQNIQVIFLVAPSLSPAHGSGVNAPPGSLLFSFDDLVRYAPLYDEDNRLDSEHLNARGAEIFTRLLAEEFAGTLHSQVR
jgi:hypothetical protein